VHRQCCETRTGFCVGAATDDLEAQVAVEPDRGRVTSEDPQDGLLGVPTRCPCLECLNKKTTDSESACRWIDPHAEEQQRRWASLATLNEPESVLAQLGDQPGAAVSVCRLSSAPMPLFLWSCPSFVDGLPKGLRGISDAPEPQAAQGQPVIRSDPSDADTRWGVHPANGSSVAPWA
jgi:hypothetical protein